MYELLEKNHFLPFRRVESWNQKHLPRPQYFLIMIFLFCVSYIYFSKMRFWSQTGRCSWYLLLIFIYCFLLLMLQIQLYIRSIMRNKWEVIKRPHCFCAQTRKGHALSRVPVKYHVDLSLRNGVLCCMAALPPASVVWVVCCWVRGWFLVLEGDERLAVTVCRCSGAEIICSDFCQDLTVKFYFFPPLPPSSP